MGMLHQHVGEDRLLIGSCLEFALSVCSLGHIGRGLFAIRFASISPEIEVILRNGGWRTLQADVRFGSFSRHNGPFASCPSLEVGWPKSAISDIKHRRLIAVTWGVPRTVASQ
jgi:hypothetical protein